jgi:hypothetical protein
MKISITLEERFLIESVSSDWFLSNFYFLWNSGKKTSAPRCNLSAFLRCFYSNASSGTSSLFRLLFVSILQFSRFRLESYMQWYRFVTLESHRRSLQRYFRCKTLILLLQKKTQRKNFARHGEQNDASFTRTLSLSNILIFGLWYESVE